MDREELNALAEYTVIEASTANSYWTGVDGEGHRYILCKRGLLWVDTAPLETVTELHTSMDLYDVEILASPMPGDAAMVASTFAAVIRSIDPSDFRSALERGMEILAGRS